MEGLCLACLLIAVFWFGYFSGEAQSAKGAIQQERLVNNCSTQLDEARFKIDALEAGEEK